MQCRALAKSFLSRMQECTSSKCTKTRANILSLCYRKNTKVFLLWVMFNHRVLINIFKRGDFLWVFAVFYGNINFILIITLVHTFVHLLLLQAMNLYSGPERFGKKYLIACRRRCRRSRQKSLPPKVYFGLFSLYRSILSFCSSSFSRLINISKKASSCHFRGACQRCRRVIPSSDLSETPT